MPDHRILAACLCFTYIVDASVTPETANQATISAHIGDPPTWLCSAIPGLISGAGAGGNVALHGVDLRTGETKSRVLPTTYTGFNGRSTTCSMDPYTKSWRKVPDLLSYTQYFSSNTDADMYFTYSFAQMDEYWQTQHKGQAFFGMYQDSSVSGFLKEQVSANESAVNSAAASESGYVVELRYTPEMLRFFAQSNQLGFNDSSFFQAQNLLPESIESDSDKAVYHSFIDAYGTHVGQQWVSGGGLAQFEMTNMSLVQHTNETWAAKQSGFAIFLGIISVGWYSAHAHGKEDMSADFKASSYNVMMAVGGNPLLLEAGGPNMLGWNASIAEAPAPYNTTAFINVSQLVVDETRRNNLQAVVDEYMAGGRAVIDPLANLRNSTCAAPPGANLSFAQLPNVSMSSIPAQAGAAFGYHLAQGTQEGDDTELRRQAKALEILRKPQLHDPCRTGLGADIAPLLTGRKLSDFTGTRALCSSRAAAALRDQGVLRSPGTLDRALETEELRVQWPGAADIFAEPSMSAPAPVGTHSDPPSRFLSQELGVGWAFNFTTGRITLPIAAPDSFEWNKTFVNPYTWAWSELPKYADLTLRPSSCMSERFIMEQNASAIGDFYASMTGVFVGFSYGISIGIGFSSEKADWNVSTKQNEFSRYSLHKELSLWDMTFGSSVWSPGQRSNDRFMPEWLEAQESYLPDPSDPAAEASFRRIAEFYGTHVVAGASLGAQCRFSVQFKSDFAQHTTGHYRATQFELILGEFVGGLQGSLDLGFNKADFRMQINETFRENSQIDWHCAGGETGILDPSDPVSYGLWLLTIAKQPVVIPTTMRLRPLYMYMQDPAKALFMKGIIEAMVRESARIESETR